MKNQQDSFNTEAEWWDIYVCDDCKIVTTLAVCQMFKVSANNPEDEDYTICEHCVSRYKAHAGHIRRIHK